MNTKIKIEYKGMALEIERMTTVDEVGSKSSCYTIAGGSTSSNNKSSYIYFESEQELQTFAEMLTEYTSNMKKQ